MEFIVATDGSAASERAIEHALDIGDGMGAKLTAVYAVEPDVYEAEHGDNTDPEQRLVIEDISDAEQRGQDALGNATEIATERGSDIETQLLYGDPVDAIPGYADEQDVDGVFVGHRGLSNEHEAVLGSVAKGLIDRASVPVTVVR